ncbi:MAG TPA: lycopene beta-cyclase CrtY [Novosphingobium sp.]|nr:lycopene beta-cyclase CrtY [Novosphingobium sp.]
MPGRWKQYEVRFPRLGRIIHTPYRSLSGRRLDAALRESLPADSLLANACVTRLDATSLTLENGRTLTAGVVIDARGASAFPGLTGGWQKFLGQLVRLERPHGITTPMLMDGRVPQRDGFRFQYILPFSADTLFIEETYYTTDPALDAATLRRRIADYLQLSGFAVAELLEEEQGLLPVVARGRLEALRQGLGTDRPEAAPAIGLRAGLFHPLTGYSLPAAAETALLVADLPELTPARLHRALRHHTRAHWQRGAYCRMLARMLFGATRGGRRFKVFERFYRLDEGLIERFYAGRLTGRDKLRIVSGKAPVPVSRAIASLLGGGLPLARLDAPQAAKEGE